MKEGVNLSEGQHRLRMVELAVEGVPMFRAEDTEIRREGLTYTVDTLREMEEASLGGDEVFLILGADAYESFELWKEPDAILCMSTLAVASRPGGAPANFEKLDSLLPQGSERGVVVPAQQLDISSSDIRDRVQQGRSLSGYVPLAVERYICDHGLYA
jgi:nicotinate-nucleotide adenylyltransferase